MELRKKAMLKRITIMDSDSFKYELDASRSGEDKYAFPWEMYIILEENCITACDNSSGDAWCEDFKTMDEAINWLIGE